MKYETARIKESFGPVELTLETIADLDRAIDELCKGHAPESAERLALEELCPYFGVIWPAAQTLARYIAEKPQVFSRKKILELGCGLALPSLVAAKIGAHVTAADFHPDVPEFLELNRKLNGVSDTDLRYLHLDWRKIQSPPERYDWIIGSDILYESSHPRDLAAAFARVVTPGVSEILLTDPGRSYVNTWVRELENLGFESKLDVLPAHWLIANRAGDKNPHEVFLIHLWNSRNPSV